MWRNYLASALGNLSRNKLYAAINIIGLAIGMAAALLLAGTGRAPAACCYFAAKDKDVLQPAQKAFLTWDPVEKVETLTVQPKFEGNAANFGMVIPTPSQPKVHERPREFFKGNRPAGLQ